MIDFSNLEDESRVSRAFDFRRIRQWSASVMSLENRIVSVIHEQFDKLPKKCKPACYGVDKEIKEWVPLAGIVVVRGRILLSE